MTTNTAGEAFQKLVDIIAQLRAPNGCPWDREQTPQSAAQYIIEEAFESVEAIEFGDTKNICEELGDLLMQPVFQAQMIADTSAQFTITDVINAITQKLLVRHPHVFGETKVADSTEVLANWEKIKADEKPKRESMLEGLPKGLPALLKAYRIGEKVSRVGFDWKTTDGVLNKIEEEAKELHQAKTPHEIEDELGDLLFTLANLARHLKVDPEAALRKASDKFSKRFQWMETQCKQKGTPLQSLTDAEWDALWNQSKK
ncbi:MAG: nucleoside triphosphate pyrophosphohydrolase [Deltaproteobacteria bacterium CG11_big_fil_rev_8_21_14_0_20_47_16]|nr:MAG: nucleoside triphosphate pyrophosphohydrolase [Deltaproteobacteria bacterium CG11_big_fil_rev_8_21_14_0_20_47_16]